MIGTPSHGGKHRPKTRTFAFSSKGSPPDGEKKRGFFRRWWWVFVAVPVVLVVAMATTLAIAYARTKVPAAPPGPETTFVYDRSGRLITTLHTEINRTIIPFSQIPESMRHAVIAIEDKNFYHEGGISPFSIVRAAWADLAHRRLEQGGSTITQQYVKNVYTGNERTFARKIREAILAVKIARVYSKDEILAKYLNTVYFGNGAYGVQAAAETYWGIPASKLSVLQSATLAALVRAPATYDPIHNPDVAKARRNTVLSLMAQQGYITQADAQQLQAEPLKVRHPKRQAAAHAYFVDYLSKLMVQQYGYQATYSGGLRVTTTLDLADQQAAEDAVAAHLKDPHDPSGALVAIDPRTGGIVAMVGGRDFNKVKLNLATQAQRQAGSAFKPFTLAAAMQARISLKSVWNGPPQIVIPNPECYTNGKPWKVANYADESAGTMELADATAHSVNTIFAQLVTTVGPTNVADIAHAMGIQSKLAPVCSITLGTQLVNPLEMADAYATLAARGIHHSTMAVSQVKNASGKTIATGTPQGSRVLGQNDADLVTFALQGVVQKGTGTAAAIGRPAAGKTGTAEKYVDAWFCGYTPQLVTCVWVGYPKGEISMQNVEGYSSVFGGSIPALIWHDFMSKAMGNMPVVNFATPNFSGYNTNPAGAVPPSPSPSPTPSPSPSPSPLPTPSLPPTPTPTPTPTPSPSPSAKPTPTPS